MGRFHREKLLVFEEAMLLIIAVDGIAAKFERKRFYVADQMRRAALSVVLNIGEGAAEFSPKEKARFFGMARRSAEEVSTCCQASVRLLLLSAQEVTDVDLRADRVMAMLTPMIKHHERVKTGPPGRHKNRSLQTQSPG